MSHFCRCPLSALSPYSTQMVTTEPGVYYNYSITGTFTVKLKVVVEWEQAKPDGGKGILQKMGDFATTVKLQGRSGWGCYCRERRLPPWGVLDPTASRISAHTGQGGADLCSDAHLSCAAAVVSSSLNSLPLGLLPTSPRGSAGI